MRFKIFIFSILGFLIGSNKSFSQGEGNFWYFGNYAGLDFNSGPPVALTNGALTTAEGCASISTSAGALLFYTDGVTVYNSNHAPMPNGTGLMGHYSATQSAIIVPKPGSATIYYVFTVDASDNNFANGLRYSEVDMSLAGGFGDVTINKNIFLAATGTEKLTAVKKANNIDFWVITHGVVTDEFLVFSVTSSGVNTTPVNSTAGSVESSSGYGYLKTSADGSKLVQALNQAVGFLQYDGFIDVLNFNTTTGGITSDFTFAATPSNHIPYGVEFSPDGKRLYVIGGTLSTDIYQYDMTLGTPFAIIASATLIGSTSAANIGAMQMAPDGKIYVSTSGAGTLGCINNPNTLGISCGYVDNAVNLSGKICQLGLPNFIPSYFSTVLSMTITSQSALCNGDCNGSATATPINGTSPYTYSWNTLPVQTTQTATNLCAGTHIVTVTDSTGETVIDSVTITQPLPITIATSSTETGCIINNGTATANPSNGIAPYTYSWNPSGQTTQTATGLAAGTYTVIVADSVGCTQTQTVSVTQVAGPTATATATLTNIILGNTTQLTATGGVTYLWTPSAGLSCTTCANPTATPAVTTTYCALVTDNNSCTDSACITINVEIPCGDVFVPNAFSPNNDGANELECVMGDCFTTFYFAIYDRWGEKVFETTDQKQCWDGKYKGKLMNTATYVYYLKGTLSTGEEVDQKGNIRLIR